MKVAGLLRRKGQFIHDSVISRWETGDRQPGVSDREVLLAIGDILDMGEEEKNDLLVKARLAPLQPEELNMDRMLGSLPKRYQQTRFLQKQMGWDEKRIGEKLGIPFWDVRADIVKAELLEQEGKAPENSLIMSIREAGAAAFDLDRGKGGRRVVFTLGNCSDNVLTVEQICLEVVGCELWHQPPPLEAKVTPFRYEIELQPFHLGEYVITEERFRYAGRDADDFDLVCMSPGGFRYKVRLKIYYSDLATNKQFIVYSDAFDLYFYKKGDLSQTVRKVIR